MRKRAENQALEGREVESGPGGPWAQM